MLTLGSALGSSKGVSVRAEKGLVGSGVFMVVSGMKRDCRGVSIV